MSREMKDSGIEWVGQIPISWTSISLKIYSGLQQRRFVRKNRTKFSV